jgi:hypothetical protein
MSGVELVLAFLSGVMMGIDAAVAHGSAVAMRHRLDVPTGYGQGERT